METYQSLQRQLDEALGRRQQLEHTIEEQSNQLKEYENKTDETKSYYMEKIQEVILLFCWLCYVIYYSSQCVQTTRAQAHASHAFLHQLLRHL